LRAFGGATSIEFGEYMRIVVGADNRGYELKDALADSLREGGHEVLDVGTNGPESVDYPDIALAVGEAIRDGRAERGVLVCGRGMALDPSGSCYWPGEEDPEAWEWRREQAALMKSGETALLSHHQLMRSTPAGGVGRPVGQPSAKATTPMHPASAGRLW
jgi:Ribose/Galactose Isomerase